MGLQEGAKRGRWRCCPSLASLLNLSFPPAHGEKLRFLFILSSVAKNEKILTAELHLFRLWPRVTDGPKRHHFCQVRRGTGRRWARDGDGMGMGVGTGMGAGMLLACCGHSPAVGAWPGSGKGIQPNVITLHRESQ